MVDQRGMPLAVRGQFLPIAGQRFEHFEVLAKAGVRQYASGAKSTLWECRCFCGKTFVVSQSRLRPTAPNRAKSCGCKRFTGEHGNRKSVSPVVVSIRALRNRYRNTARKRNLEWSLSDSEFSRLVLAPCHYCGTAASRDFNVYSTRSGRYRNGIRDWMQAATLQYTGIDRADNSLGYTAANCVSCCQFCNFAKHAHSLADFESWLDRVAAFRGRK